MEKIAKHEDFVVLYERYEFPWIMDDNRPVQPVGVLQGNVGMVPEGAALVGDVEGVGERLAGGDGALGYAVDAVHPVGVTLVDAMPVD